MEKIFDILVTTAFGLEGVVKKECQNLGFDNLIVSNGRIEFKGDFESLVKANLWLRSADRVFIKLLEFDAFSYDDIYDNIRNYAWEEIIHKDGQVIVLGKSFKSKMFSISDNQAMTKKAIADRLGSAHMINWLPETGERYKVTIDINKDKARILLDSSGDGLHKRGYRTKQNQAPIKETLAAALVMLSAWTPDRPFVDLFCGSGTLPIEAALIGKNIAPGISRDFDLAHWKLFDQDVYKNEKTKAFRAIKDIDLDIMGFDIDKKAIEISKDNAINAGLDQDIKFINKDMAQVGLRNNFGVIVSNPPYGERMGDEDDMKAIYKAISNLFQDLTTWSMYFVTSDKAFERQVSRSADQKRKLYNGRIEVDYYQYLGPKPLNLLLEEFNE